MLVGFRINYTRPSPFSFFEHDVAHVSLETLYSHKPKMIVVKQKILLLDENCDLGESFLFELTFARAFFCF